MAQQNKAPKEVQITITSTTVLKIVAILAGVALLYFLRDILALVLISLLIAVSVDPIVDMMVKHKIPRAVSAGLVFLSGIIIFTGILLLVIPNVIAEAGGLIANYSWLIEDLTSGAIPLESWMSDGYVSKDAGEIVETIKQSGFLEALPAISTFASTMFGGMLSIILVLALSFYMVIGESQLRQGVSKFLSTSKQKMLDEMLPVVRIKIGAWLRGQLSLMLIMFTVTYTILLLLDIPFALVLALVAGLMDIIPFIGAILVFLPIVLVALSASPVQALLVAIALIVNQQIHGDIVTPKIMQKAAGMNPVLTIIVVLVGFEVAGAAGAILAIPAAMLISVFLDEWLSRRK